MATARPHGERRERRSQPPPARAPRLALAYLALCAALVIGWTASTALNTANLGADVWRVVLLAVLAVAFEEGSAHAARLRIRFGADLTQDLTSVWSFGAAIALPRLWAVSLVVVILGYTWLRQDRPAGVAAYRGAFNVTNVALASLAAAGSYSTLSGAWSDLPGGMDGFLPVVVAMLVYAIANRAVVTGFLLCRRVPRNALIGSRDENLIEFATLCLGGLVALAVIYQPWLAVLAVAPMIALQRGARMRVFETAATTDGKTSLLNALAWEHVAQRELARAQRLSTPLAVLIVDIDRFKLVNDVYGHLSGDVVLREVGRCLAHGVREYDTVGRFGGEEFVAVLPEANDADALVIAERLRSRVNALRIRDLVDQAGPDDDTVVSVSIGVATTAASMAEVDLEISDLLRDADAALYRAKNAGRNRVVLAERGGGPSDARLSLT